MKIIIIDGKQYELVPIIEAFKPTIEPKRCFVENGDRFYPIYFGLPPIGLNEHGLFISGPLYRIHTDESNPFWLLCNQEVIDFNNLTSMEEMYKRNNQLTDIMKETLVPDREDNIYYHEIQNDESNLMKALQLFLNSKQISTIRYADRFANYANTIRILNKDRISIDKFMEFIVNMDAKATITIENREENVANPIPSPIVMEL